MPMLQERRTAVARVKQLDTAVPTLREWRTAVARVQPTAAALDSATQVLGIRHLGSHSQNTSHKGETHGGRSSSNYAQDHTDHSDRGLTLNLETIHSDLKDTVTLGLPLVHELQTDSGGGFNPETIHSDLHGIVTLGRPPGQDLQPAHSDTLKLETIHSNLDDIATRGLAPSLELNLDRGKSLPAGWQTIVPDTDDTPATALSHRWEQYRSKMLPSTNPELDDDDAWKLVPYFGAVLLFFSWIVQSWTRREKGQSGQAQV